MRHDIARGGWIDNERCVLDERVIAIVSDVAVVGTGYVGLTTGACLAHLGFMVTCCDIDEHKIAQLRRGLMPIVEEGLARIALPAMEDGRLTFALGCDPAVRTADIVFLCVPTPQGDDGSADLTYVEAAATEIGPLLKPGAIVVNKSTVPVGSAASPVEALGSDRRARGVATPSSCARARRYTISCIRTASSSAPTTDGAARRVAGALRRRSTPPMHHHRPGIGRDDQVRGQRLPGDEDLLRQRAWPTMCEARRRRRPEVVDGMGSDRADRPAPSCSPGRAGAAVASPRTSHALRRDRRPARLRLLADAWRDRHQQAAAPTDGAQDRIGRRPRELRRVSTASSGRARPDVQGRHRRPARLAQPADHRHAASARGDRAGVRPHDQGPADCRPEGAAVGIQVWPLALDVAHGADVLVVLTEWPEFTEVDAEKVADLMTGTAIVDCRNLLDGERFRKAGLRYQGVGLP